MFEYALTSKPNAKERVVQQHLRVRMVMTLKIHKTKGPTIVADVVKALSDLPGVSDAAAQKDRTRIDAVAERHTVLKATESEHIRDVL